MVDYHNIVKILNNIFKGNSSKNKKIEMFVEYISENIDEFINNTESKNIDNNFNFKEFG